MESNTTVKNIKLTLSWNGASFSGYQYQPHAFTVQEALNTAWKTLTGEVVTLYGCSRLDAGVHAHQFVLNFHSHTLLGEEAIVRGLNGILHSVMKVSISIYRCEFVSPEFHARFHAVGKHYRYLIWQGFAHHALLTPQCWHVRSRQNLQKLGEILKQFEGTHDFSAYRASDCATHASDGRVLSEGHQKPTVKTIFKVAATPHPEFPEMITVDIWGDGFLKNMIRNMVGTAVEVATGKLSDKTITDSFMHGKRELVGTCAPGWGLSLRQVFYKKEVLQAASEKGSSV